MALWSPDRAQLARESECCPANGHVLKPSQRCRVSAGLPGPRMRAGNVCISYWPRSRVCLGLEAPHWTVKPVSVLSLQELDGDIIVPQAPARDGAQAPPTKPSKRHPPTGPFLCFLSR